MIPLQFSEGRVHECIVPVWESSTALPLRYHKSLIHEERREMCHICKALSVKTLTQFVYLKNVTGNRWGGGGTVAEGVVKQHKCT